MNMFYCFVPVTVLFLFIFYPLSSYVLLYQLSFNIFSVNLFLPSIIPCDYIMPVFDNIFL